MPFIELSGVTKQFPNGTVAVDHVDIDIHEGEFVVLVGPSGCGKTTLLRMLAGLETTTSGSIVLNGEDVSGLDPGDRDMAMVFQNYALYPHMTVYKNISFGLRMNGVDRAEIDQRVRAAAKTLQITELLDRRPAQLSGGQRQRVAMGRAIVRKPNAFLMDEPLSNLDAKLRVQMRAEVSRIQRELGTTTIYVTHDQIEAMTMGDRVALLSKGVLQQMASPEVLFDEPANVFVASFIGSPPMNLVEATVDVTGDDVGIRVGTTRFAVPDADQRFPGLGQRHGQRVVLGFRAEYLTVAPGTVEQEGKASILGHVVLTEMLGTDVMVHAVVDAPRVVTEAAHDVSDDEHGESDEVIDDADGRAMVIGRSDRSSVVREVDALVTLLVDIEHIHLFDFDTGASLLATA